MFVTAGVGLLAAILLEAIGRVVTRRRRMRYGLPHKWDDYEPTAPATE